MYSRASGIPLCSLTALSFITAFHEGETFPLLKRDGGEDSWKSLRKSLGRLLVLVRREDTEETVFQIYVKMSDTMR